jgi:hypothetical protein
LRPYSSGLLDAVEMEMHAPLRAGLAERRAKHGPLELIQQQRKEGRAGMVHVVTCSARIDWDAR